MDLTVTRARRLADPRSVAGGWGERYRGRRVRVSRAERWENVLGSAEAFLVLFVICLILVGVGAYVYARWSVGPEVMLVPPSAP